MNSNVKDEVSDTRTSPSFAFGIKSDKNGDLVVH